MSRYHGITGNTVKKLVFDSGAVYKNFVSVSNPGTLIGATRGGSTFTIETEYKDMPIDGAKGLVKGARRITKVNCKLVANFIEITNALLIDALPGSEKQATTYGPDHITIGRSLDLTDANYLSNVTLLAQMSGSNDPIGVMILNALCDGGFEMAYVDNEETGLSVQFTGHFTPTDLDTEPWNLLYPEDLTTTVAP